MLNSSIELDVILLEQFEEFFGIFSEWMNRYRETCLNFLLMGMAIAVLWLWDRGGYRCSVGVN